MAGIRSDFGWHLVQIDARQAGRTLLFVVVLAIGAAILSRAARLPSLQGVAVRVPVQAFLFYGVGILAASWAVDRFQ